MFEFFGARAYAVLSFIGVLAVHIAVIIRAVALLGHNALLCLRAGVADSWAAVVFWQPVLTSELSAAEGTAKRHHGFCTACLAFHDCWRLSIVNIGGILYFYAKNMYRYACKG